MKTRRVHVCRLFGGGIGYEYEVRDHGLACRNPCDGLVGVPGICKGFAQGDEDRLANVGGMPGSSSVHDQSDAVGVDAGYNADETGPGDGEDWDFSLFVENDDRFVAVEDFVGLEVEIASQERVVGRCARWGKDDGRAADEERVFAEIMSNGGKG